MPAMGPCLQDTAGVCRLPNAAYTFCIHLAVCFVCAVFMWQTAFLPVGAWRGQRWWGWCPLIPAIIKTSALICSDSKHKGVLVNRNHPEPAETVGGVRALLPRGWAAEVRSASKVS